MKTLAGWRRTCGICGTCVLAALACLAWHTAPAAPDAAPASVAASAPAKPRLDFSGHKRVGKASYYAHRFAGRRMANGRRMDPNADIAASKTLPLGTRARVTNLQTGRSADVTIEDRGPYVKGRIVDLSPAVANKIGITRDEGVAKVEVAPIAVPLPDGRVKPGAALDDAPAGAERGQRSGG